MRNALQAAAVAAAALGITEFINNCNKTLCIPYSYFCLIFVAKEEAKKPIALAGSTSKTTTDSGPETTLPSVSVKKIDIPAG